MIVQQFFVNGLAHISYILGGSKTCVVIDPRRDIQIYLDTAAPAFPRAFPITTNYSINEPGTEPTSSTRSGLAFKEFSRLFSLPLGSP